MLRQIVQVTMDNFVLNAMPKTVLLALIIMSLMKNITTAVNHPLKITWAVHNMRAYVLLLVPNVSQDTS